MVKYTFNDEDSRPPIVEPGNYILRVVAAEEKISRGGKTAGAPMFALKCEVEGYGTILFENLVMTEKAAWKVDTALKSLGFSPNGAPLKKGDTVQIYAQDLVNLRGWATLGVDDYLGRQKNIIVAWITNRGALPPFSPPAGANIADEDVPF